MAGLDKHYDRNLSGSSREAKGRMPDRTVRQWKLLLFRAFAEIIGAFAKKGSLRLNYRGLEEVSFGDGTGPQFSVRLNSLWTILRIVRNTDLGCGESYMDEGWILERGERPWCAVWAFNDCHFPDNFPPPSESGGQPLTARHAPLSGFESQAPGAANLGPAAADPYDPPSSYEDYIGFRCGRDPP